MASTHEFINNGAYHARKEQNNKKKYFYKSKCIVRSSHYEKPTVYLFFHHVAFVGTGEQGTGEQYEGVMGDKNSHLQQVIWPH